MQIGSHKKIVHVMQTGVVTSKLHLQSRYVVTSRLHSYICVYAWHCTLLIMQMCGPKAVSKLNQNRIRAASQLHRTCFKTAPKTAFIILLYISCDSQDFSNWSTETGCVTSEWWSQLGQNKCFIGVHVTAHAMVWCYPSKVLACMRSCSQVMMRCFFSHHK
jgi:hypothetical protein